MDGSWQSLFKNEKTLPGNPHKIFAKAGEAPLPQCHAGLWMVLTDGLIAALVAPFSSIFPLGPRF